MEFTFSEQAYYYRNGDEQWRIISTRTRGSSAQAWYIEHLEDSYWKFVKVFGSQIEAQYALESMSK